MTITLGGLGVAFLVLWFLLHKAGKAPTTAAVLAFTGICLIAGTAAGAVGFDLLIKGVQLLENLLSDLTYLLIHQRVGALALVLICGFTFVMGLHPKNKADKKTGLAGIALALLLIVGVAQFPALNNIPAAVRNGVGNAQSSIQSGGH